MKLTGAAGMLAPRLGHVAPIRGVSGENVISTPLSHCTAELKWLNDVAGKSVAVLGSGDNQTVFALVGLGAKVTSVDISEQQIEIARNRAAVLGLSVDFLRADVVDLGELGDAAFDFAYTGSHVAVWVADLNRYYAEAARILKPEGLLIVSEYHPFRRVWRDCSTRLELACNYFDRGPHRFEAAQDVLWHEPGELEQFEIHWTVGRLHRGDACFGLSARPCRGIWRYVRTMGRGAHGGLAGVAAASRPPHSGSAVPTQ